MDTRFRVFFIITLLICGLSKKITIGFGNIDLAFKPHLEQWVKEARKYADPKYELPTISVVFADDSDFKVIKRTVIGICLPIPYNPIVKIHRGFWNISGNEVREQLLFHELGHCLLNRWHNDKVVDGEPVTLMHPFLNATEVVYSYKREYYIKELFTKEE